MFVIGEVFIEERLAGERFACDLRRCKGACCTLPGGRGAPLRDDELAQIHTASPHAMKYLSAHHRAVIESDGMFEGVPGSFATTCIDNQDCVFVFYDEGVARCSLEKAYHAGETAFRKPISCFLFPIRLSTNGRTEIHYEEIAECRSGRTRGRQEEIPLTDFLKDPLVARFGLAWYDEFQAACAGWRENKNSVDINQRSPT